MSLSRIRPKLVFKFQKELISRKLFKAMARLVTLEDNWLKTEKLFKACKNLDRENYYPNIWKETEALRKTVSY